MFQVRWSDLALNGLTDLWTQADSATRTEITAATNEIDRRLGRDPLGVSESRPDDRRIIFEFPLGVIFRVEDDARTVQVLRVWLVRRSS